MKKVMLLFVALWILGILAGAAWTASTDTVKAPDPAPAAEKAPRGLDKSPENTDTIFRTNPDGSKIEYGTWYKKERTFVPAKGKTKDEVIAAMYETIATIIAQHQQYRTAMQTEVDYLYGKLGRIAVKEDLEKNPK